MEAYLFCTVLCMDVPYKCRQFSCYMIIKRAVKVAYNTIHMKKTQNKDYKNEYKKWK